MAKPLNLSATERLGVLRKLDRRHAWSSPDERRLCLGCGQLIRGWEILVVRSMRARAVAIALLSAGLRRRGRSIGFADTSRQRRGH